MGSGLSSAGHAHVLVSPNVLEQQSRRPLRLVEGEAVVEACNRIISELGVGVEDENQVIRVPLKRQGDRPDIVSGWGDGLI